MADWTITHGCALDVLRGMPDASVDAICTDPPYGLGSPPDALAMLRDWLGTGHHEIGSAAKGKKHCASRIIGITAVANSGNGDAGGSEERVSFRVFLSARGMAVVRPVDLNDPRQGWKVEVHDDAEGPDRKLLLVKEGDSETRERINDGEFVLAGGKGAGCNGICASLPETPNGRVGILVRLRDYALRETDGSRCIVASPGAELRAVLTLDLSGGTALLLPTQTTGDCGCVVELRRTERVGASATATGLPSPLQAGGVRQVGDTAHGTVTVSRELLSRVHRPIIARGGMMGKAWDAFVPQPELWRECLRVLKPGGHLLAFAGTRTQDLMGLGLRIAGFELRDCLAWVFGVGFPKSLNVSKAIDAAAGATREVVGTKAGLPGWSLAPSKGADVYGKGIGGTGSPEAECAITAPATDAARQWEGWGTALKPALEVALLVRKPHDVTGLAGVAARSVEGLSCQLRSPAKSAAESSPSSQSGSPGDESGSVPCSAAPPSNTPGDSHVATDTLPSELAPHSSLSIASSWQRILIEVLRLANTFTTETASGLTTDLKTLNSYLSNITPDCITLAAARGRGTSPNVWRADALLSVVAAKLDFIRACSADAPAISTDDGAGLRPNLEPCILARKPFPGTVAGNVLEHGTGALNVDGCRIEGAKPDTDRGAGGQNGRYGALGAQGAITDDGAGRWPANLLFDEAAAAMLDASVGVLSSGANPTRRGSDKFGDTFGRFKGQEQCTPARGAEKGGPSRFFYTAKASRSERDLGCEDLAHKSAGEVTGGRADGSAGLGPRAGAGRTSGGRNSHPCVKPVDLMRWLVRLITPPGGVCLDPFMGSGSTGVACIEEGFGFIGIEREAEYVEIARARLAGASRQGRLFDAAPAVATPTQIGLDL